jgi:thiol-disulfide isomerase/thioredoxin
MWRILLILVLTAVQCRADEFTYGLWGSSRPPAAEKPARTEKQSAPKKGVPPPRLTWKDFMPKNLPKPLERLLENPDEKTAREYWKAYKDYVTRLAKAESAVRVLQMEYARKISKNYQIYYFFNPFCPACEKYTPELFLSMVKEGFSVPVKAYVVHEPNRDRGREFAGGLAMMNALGVSTVRLATPVLLDEMGVQRIPTAVVLNSAGEVVAEFEGGDVLNVLNFLKEKRDEAIGSDADNSADSR